MGSKKFMTTDVQLTYSEFVVNMTSLNWCFHLVSVGMCKTMTKICFSFHPCIGLNEYFLLSIPYLGEFGQKPVFDGSKEAVSCGRAQMIFNSRKQRAGDAFCRRYLVILILLCQQKLLLISANALKFINWLLKKTWISCLLYRISQHIQLYNYYLWHINWCSNQLIIFKGAHE